MLAEVVKPGGKSKSNSTWGESSSSSPIPPGITQKQSSRWESSIVHPGVTIGRLPKNRLPRRQLERLRHMCPRVTCRRTWRIGVPRGYTESYSVRNHALEEVGAALTETTQGLGGRVPIGPAGNIVTGMNGLRVLHRLVEQVQRLRVVASNAADTSSGDGRTGINTTSARLAAESVPAMGRSSSLSPV